jgi:hypothetical protein
MYIKPVVGHLGMNRTYDRIKIFHFVVRYEARFRVYKTTRNLSRSPITNLPVKITVLKNRLGKMCQRYSRPFNTSSAKAVDLTALHFDYYSKSVYCYNAARFDFS